MYRGEVMESGTMRRHLPPSRSHPYLKALLRAVPRFDMKPGERLEPIREIEPAGGSCWTRRPSPGRRRRRRPGRCSSVSHITKRFAIAQERAGSAASPKAAACWPSTMSASRSRRGECLGLVGESGCGKTTLSQDPHAGARRPIPAASCFNDRGSMVDVLELEGDELMRVPPQDPVHLPGPVRLAQPAHDGVRHRRRAADHPRHRRRRAPRARWCSELMQPGRSRRAAPQPLPAQLLRRPAPAHRHRPRAGAPARAADLRRAGLGARRLDPGADPQPAEGPAGASSA